VANSEIVHFAFSILSHVVGVGQQRLTLTTHKEIFLVSLSVAFPIFFKSHRTQNRERETTMSTLKVPQSPPPVSDDCEQLRKAFEGFTSFFLF
jgi:hypothetical protein